MAKAEELYLQYKEDALSRGETPIVMAFSDKWLQGWCEEYCVSFKSPNKRVSILPDVRKERLLQHFKNIYRIRYFMMKKYNTEPDIVGADQMPLYRNQSSNEKTMNTVREETYVKENHTLSRERTTTMTIYSTNNDDKFNCEFLFKGMGKRAKATPPPQSNMTVQWAPKGSYRLPNMITFIRSLPKVPFELYPQKRKIFILDDYSVHIQPDIAEELVKKGYIPTFIGGGITGDVQINDTHLHHPLKKRYRECEMKAMIVELQNNPGKIPRPSRDDMMAWFYDAWQSVYPSANLKLAAKQNLLQLTLDGSEDHLAGQRLWDLVGNELVTFRTELLASSPAKNFSDLMKSLTPPEGCVIKRLAGNEEPQDEGAECYLGQVIDPEDDSELNDPAPTTSSGLCEVTAEGTGNVCTTLGTVTRARAASSRAETVHSVVQGNVNDCQPVSDSTADSTADNTVGHDIADIEIATLRKLRGQLQELRGQRDLSMRPYYTKMMNMCDLARRKRLEDLKK